jgi:hypothetical protein
MKKRMIKILLVALGCLFCMSSVYAASSTYQQFTMWANKQKNQAEQQVKTNLNNNVEAQMAALNEKTNQLLLKSSNEITAMGNQEKLETTESINNKLNAHKENLNAVSEEIQTNSTNDFSKITENVKNHTNELVKSYETDFQADLGEMAFHKLDQETVKQQTEQSNQKLEEEIQLTFSAIQQLEELKKEESNELVKEYIQRKINFLNDLILLLNEDEKDNI